MTTVTTIHCIDIILVARSIRSHQRTTLFDACFRLKDSAQFLISSFLFCKKKRKKMLHRKEGARHLRMQNKKVTRDRIFFARLNCECMRR